MPRSAEARSAGDRAVIRGRYRILPELGIVLRDGEKLALGPRAFDVLCMLLEARGGLVGKDQLLDRVWAGAIVEENNLQVQISAVRKALGPDRNMLSTDFGRGYRLNVDEQTGGGLDPDAAEAMPHSELPHPLTAMLGREGPLSSVIDLATAHRLSTIVGPGGIGKTRLAIEAGRRLGEAFPGGVRFADMSAIATGDAVLPTLSACLGLAAGELRPGVRLPSRLREGRLLLLVDGAEHLARSIASILAPLLRGEPRLHVLGTSQEPLDLDGEQVYRLEPLRTPSSEDLTAEAARDSPAVQLLVERASAASHGFALDEAVAPILGAICQRLDGIPLALELAAPRIAASGAESVLAGLDARFSMLTNGRRSALPRQRTLRATVEWSHALLDLEEARLLRRLGVFSRSFIAEAATAVAMPDAEAPWRAADLLRSLVDKSLLARSSSGRVPRYRLLETIRLYALEKLAEAGETEATVQRHITFFARTADDASRDWIRLATGAWRDAYQAEFDEIRAALDRATMPGRDPSVGVALLTSAVPFWIDRSLHGECRLRISRVLARLQDEAALSPSDELPLQLALGTSLSWAEGPVPEARAAWTRAEALARGRCDPEGRLRALYGLWLHELRAGHADRSLRHASELAELGASIGDADAQATGGRIAGVSRHFLGEHAAAALQIQESIRCFEARPPEQAFRFGLDQHVAGLAFLSRVLWVTGRCSDAIATAERAVERASGLDHACSLCCALAEGLCMVQALDGDVEGVQRSSATLIRLAVRHGLGFWKVFGDLFALWAAHHRPGSVPLARLEALVGEVRDIGFDPFYARLLIDMLVDAHRAGQDPASLARLSRRLRHLPGNQVGAALRSTDHHATPELLRLDAHLHAEGAEERRSGLEAALAVASRQGAHASALRIAVELCELSTSEAGDDEAALRLSRTLDAFPDGRASRRWRDAAAIIAPRSIALLPPRP